MPDWSYKVLPLAIIDLAFVIAQSVSEPKLPVIIESWHYDPQAKTVTLHLVNNSHKDVTAYNISIDEKYADGSTNYLDDRPNDIHDHQMMEDMLGAMINIQMGVVGHGSGTLAVGAAVGNVGAMREAVRQTVPQEGNGTFAAGTSRDHLIHEAKDISDIEAVVDVVAYVDGTAQAQNNDRAFRQLMAERKGQLLAMQKVTEVIKRVLAEPMVISPFDVAIRELTPPVESADKHGSPENPESNAAMHLHNDVKNLQMVQRSKSWSQMRMTEREGLAWDVEEHEKRIALMKPHCELVTKRQKPGQLRCRSDRDEKMILNCETRLKTLLYSERGIAPESAES